MNTGFPTAHQQHSLEDYSSMDSLCLSMDELLDTYVFPNTNTLCAQTLSDTQQSNYSSYTGQHYQEQSQEAFNMVEQIERNTKVYSSADKAYTTVSTKRTSNPDYKYQACRQLFHPVTGVSKRSSKRNSSRRLSMQQFVSYIEKQKEVLEDKVSLLERQNQQQQELIRALLEQINRNKLTEATATVPSLPTKITIPTTATNPLLMVPNTNQIISGTSTACPSSPTTPKLQQQQISTTTNTTTTTTARYSPQPTSPSFTPSSPSFNRNRGNSIGPAAGIQFVNHESQEINGWIEKYHESKDRPKRKYSRKNKL